MFNLFIATPETTIFEGEALSVTVPGTMGFFEILTDHAPILSTLKAGPVVVVSQDNTRTTWTITEGYLEATNNRVTLLADTADKGK